MTEINHKDSLIRQELSDFGNLGSQIHAKLSELTQSRGQLYNEFKNLSKDY